MVEGYVGGDDKMSWRATQEDMRIGTRGLNKGLERRK